MVCKVDMEQGIGTIQDENLEELKVAANMIACAIKELEGNKATFSSNVNDQSLDALALNVIDDIYSIASENDDVNYKIYYNEHNIHICVCTSPPDYCPLVTYSRWAWLSSDQRNMLWSKVRMYLMDTVKDHGYCYNNIDGVVHLKPQQRLPQVIIPDIIASGILKRLLDIIGSGDKEQCFCVALGNDDNISLTNTKLWENISNNVHKVIWGLVKDKIKESWNNSSDYDDGVIIHPRPRTSSIILDTAKKAMNALEKILEDDDEAVLEVRVSDFGISVLWTEQDETGQEKSLVPKSLWAKMTRSERSLVWQQLCYFAKESDYSFEDRASYFFLNSY